MPHLRVAHLDDIEQQYRKILHTDWTEAPVFDEKTPTDTVEFWSGILQYTISFGCFPFSKLAMYVMSCLSMPVRSAAVERIFSSVTNTKTKVPNCLGSEMQSLEFELIFRSKESASGTS